MDHRSEIEIHGHCAPEFARVADAFASNFASAGEIGAAVAVCVEGEMVVDLWGGSVLRDDRLAGPWRADTIVRMMSVNKAMTALCAHLLIDRGLLDLTEPVARYWPEFAQAGKQDITVRQLLGGLAGLIYPDEVPAGSAYDWDRMVEGLAAQAPAFPPGTRGAYHSSTYGHLVGELVRRVDGRRPGQFFREEIATPFEIDYWFAVPESNGIASAASAPIRRATLIPPSAAVHRRRSAVHGAYFRIYPPRSGTPRPIGDWNFRAATVAAMRAPRRVCSVFLPRTVAAVDGSLSARQRSHVRSHYSGTPPAP